MTAPVNISLESLLSDIQTVLAKLEGTDPTALLAEVKTGIADVTEALTVIDKFSVLLPAQYSAPLQTLLSVLTAVNGYVQKL